MKINIKNEIAVTVDSLVRLAISTKSLCLDSNSTLNISRWYPD